jgi:hypothetical protein
VDPAGTDPRAAHACAFAQAIDRRAHGLAAAVASAALPPGCPEYYRQVARRIDHNRACLSVARKLCRRAYHILRELGDEALAPIDAPTDEEVIAAVA